MSKIAIILSVAAVIAAGASLKISVDAQREALSARSVAISRPVQTGTIRPSRTAWEGLGQNKTIAIGESLRGTGAPKVTIFCGNEDCREFSSDLDDAFQIAEWPSDFERGPAMAGGILGLVIGPPGPLTEQLKNALLAVLPNTPIEIEPVAVKEGEIGIIIGKRP